VKRFGQSVWQWVKTPSAQRQAAKTQLRHEQKAWFDWNKAYNPAQRFRPPRPAHRVPQLKTAEQQAWGNWSRYKQEAAEKPVQDKRYALRTLFKDTTTGS
jgi:hypothetical protein